VIRVKWENIFGGRTGVGYQGGEQVGAIESKGIWAVESAMVPVDRSSSSPSENEAILIDI
jgi:hypothetical protein